jgi:hypothetical protein
LFWADVAEQRAHERQNNSPTHFRQVAVFPRGLWQFGEGDLAWLYEDLDVRATEAEQQIALSGIVAILQTLGRLDAGLPRINALIKNRPRLKMDLAGYLAPPTSLSGEMRRHELSMAKHQQQRAEQERTDKDSWRRFEQELLRNPGQLCDPQTLANWKAGAWRLWDLTRWLMRRAESTDEVAPTHWRLLEEGFGREVAEAYRDGLKIHWRLTKPERPKRRKNGRITIKYPTVLAFGAVGVEAGEDPNWTSYLSDDEARRAALHGCLSEQTYPEWIEALIPSHPRVALPVIRGAVRYEYLSAASGRSDFVYRYGRGTQPIHPAIQKILFDLIAKKEPHDTNKFDCMLGMAERIDLTPKQRKKLFRITEMRLAAHRSAQRGGEARWSLAMLLLLDFNQGLSHLERWLTDVPAAQAKEHAELTFAFLFDPHNPTVPSVLPNAAVLDLERLLRLVYTHIRSEADAHREGSYSPDTRDHAENARNFILGAILDRPGADAYHALRRVADDPAFALRASRFRELAHGKAERDAELAAWTPKEVLTFERERTAPVKAGTDLLRLVEAVLNDIQFQFDKRDASSRRLLQRAQDEDEVQNWLVEQLNLRARGRFMALREAEVAQGDKPDVIIASTSAACQVALEVKHSKNWTLRQLDNALRNQLAENYLKPEERRHGVLVITHHLARQWRDTETNEQMTFDGLIERLASVAATLVRNAAGAIEVKCIGLDTTERML